MCIDEAAIIMYKYVLRYGFNDKERALFWLRGMSIRETGMKVKGQYLMNNFAKGADGEIGFMQPMPDTVKTFNMFTGSNYTISDMLNPDKCADVGVWYFYKCLSKHKRYDRSIMAYNAGINRKKYRNTNYYYDVRRFSNEACTD
jgi:hypothetical protein